MEKQFVVVSGVQCEVTMIIGNLEEHGFMAGEVVGYEVFAPEGFELVSESGEQEESFQFFPDEIREIAETHRLVKVA